MKIGLAISTYVPEEQPNLTNRLRETLTSLETSTDFPSVWVVDDGSTDQGHLAYLAALPSRYRVHYSKHGGVASVKNRCLELLENCGIGFLADDDILFSPGWDVNYLNAHICSGIHHFSWADSTTSLKTPRIVHNFSVMQTQLLNGAFLTFTSTVLTTVGGFKMMAAPWGHEHTNWTKRIISAGLSPFFVDIRDSNSYISLNRFSSESAVTPAMKQQYAIINEAPSNELTPLYLPYVYES